MLFSFTIYYFWLCSVFIAVCGLSPVAMASLVAEHGLQGLRASAVAAAQGLGCPVVWGASWTRDQTGVPCIARQILNHWLG